MAARIRVTPLLPHFAARVEDVTLSRMDETTFQQVFDAFQEHSVLVFHDQRLTDEEQMAFSRRFGPLEDTIKAPGKENRHHPNLVDLSNLDPDHDGKLDRLEGPPHALPVRQPAVVTATARSAGAGLASLLSGRELPPAGGETEFAACDTLRHPPAETQRGGSMARWPCTASVLTPYDRAEPLRSRAADELAAGRQALVRAHPVNARSRSTSARTPGSRGHGLRRSVACSPSCSPTPRARTSSTSTGGSSGTS